MWPFDRTFMFRTRGIQEQLVSTLRFLGEPVEDEQDLPTEDFFGKISTFFRNLQKASLDLHLVAGDF